MSHDDKLKSFQFHIPIELVKSDNADEEAPDSWRIQGIASTPDPDLQGEQVIQEGLDISVLKAGRGLFNNDHLKGPENVLGQIDEADFQEFNGKKALLVKGFLFKHQDRAKAYYNIMRSLRKGSPPRVHFSIEGKVLERDYSNTSRIKKARIDKVALTLDPVNPNTFANLVKSLVEPEVQAPETIPVNHSDGQLKAEVIKAVEAFIKAMVAGSGYASAPELRTNGSAMQSESLESGPKDMSNKKLKKNKKINKAMIKSLIDTACQLLPSADPALLSDLVCQRIEKKIKGAS